MKLKITSVAIALPICLSLASFPVSAIESGIEGSQVTINKSITSTTPVTLGSSRVIIPPGGGKWHCAITCSAEAVVPKGLGTLDNRLVLGVNIDNDASTLPGCDRTIDFDDNPGIDDENRETITTTCPFKNISVGTHNAFCSARKEAAGDVDMAIDDASMTVVCSDNLL
jgi:hypothetical protein